MLAAPFTQCAESVTQLWLAQLQQSQLVLSGCWREFRESKEPVRYLPVVVIKITGRPASLAGKDRLRNQTASVCRSWCCFDVSRPRFRKWISKALERGKSQENVLSESSDCYCVAHFVRQFIRTFPLNPTQLIEKKHLFMPAWEMTRLGLGDGEVWLKSTNWYAAELAVSSFFIPPPPLALPDGAHCIISRTKATEMAFAERNKFLLFFFPQKFN